jgi:hypothetical protein
MSLTRTHTAVITVWFAVVIGLLGARIALGTVPVTAAESAAWLSLACIPAAVLLFVFRRASPTIAQVLYETEQTVNTADVNATRSDSHAARR